MVIESKKRTGDGLDSNKMGLMEDVLMDSDDVRRGQIRAAISSTQETFMGRILKWVLAYHHESN